MNKNEENWRNSNRLIKLSEIWYEVTSSKKKLLQKIIFRFWHFLAKKHPKLTKNEANWHNTNRLMKFSKIWYVNTFYQRKIQQKNYSLILAFFGQKTS